MNHQQCMYAIFDTKVGSFGAPFFAANTAAALRTVSDAVQSPESQLNRHPADFELVHVALFDTVTGVVTPVQHSNLGNMVQFLKAKEAPPMLRAMEGGR